MPDATCKSRTYSVAEICLVLVVIGMGVALRASYLDSHPFWVDEAESSINALTILDKGYPSDTYLGLPIYENVLVQPWPESEEYEFRDISYSDRHMAIYHGWLPLYAIAASFAAHHIRPDEPDASFRVKHNLEDQQRRTRAARLPGILFGAVFLALAFVGGTTLYGRDAGWAALLVAAIHPWHLILSRQARYYSAEVTLTTACCVLLWLIVKQGRWRHFLLAGCAFVLLFHTHLLSFFTGMVVLFLFSPIIIWKHPLRIRKLAAFSAIVAAGSLPWIIITGFLRQQTRIPRGWPLLHLPADLKIYPPAQLLNLTVGLIFVLLLGWLLLTKSQVSQRLKVPMLASSSALILLSVWIACGYIAFLLFMPAASFYVSRLNLSYWGPGLLLASVVCAAVARIVTRRFSIVAAPALFLTLFFVAGNRVEFPSHQSSSYRVWDNDEEFYQQLRAMRFEKDTKLYASPPNHLILSFYTGMPFQSIAPVRKGYLDNYKGNIFFVDSAYSNLSSASLQPEQIEKAALQNGQRLDWKAAKRCSLLLRTREYREAIQKIVAGEQACVPEDIPAYSKTIVEAAQHQARAVLLAFAQELPTRGFDLKTWLDWRNVSVYRFVDPTSRSGTRSNYAERLRGAHALLLLGPDKVIYDSPWHAAKNGRSVDFEIRP